MNIMINMMKAKQVEKVVNMMLHSQEPVKLYRETIHEIGASKDISLDQKKQLLDHVNEIYLEACYDITTEFENQKLHRAFNNEEEILYFLNRIEKLAMLIIKPL